MNVARRSVARRDVRLRALGLTLAMIAITGALVWYLPGRPGKTPATDGFDVTRHMQAQRVATRFREAVNLLHTGHHAEAVLAWEDVIAMAPTLPEARVNLGYAHLGLGQAAEAEQAFRAALALRESQANAHYGLALALAKQQRMAEARAAMRRFLRYSGPGDPYLARAHELLKQWQAEENK
ncbi:MAG TPA: tetratricopeptide repeat protein [Gammaproteobacteria bacterium]|nr:tetratricopeptide repeat protein [Gammaproteobacteria bacterium]